MEVPGNPGTSYYVLTCKDAQKKQVLCIGDDAWKEKEKEFNCYAETCIPCYIIRGRPEISTFSTCEIRDGIKSFCDKYRFHKKRGGSKSYGLRQRKRGFHCNAKQFLLDSAFDIPSSPKKRNFPQCVSFETECR